MSRPAPLSSRDSGRLLPPIVVAALNLLANENRYHNVVDGHDEQQADRARTVPQPPAPGASSADFWESLYRTAPSPTGTRPNIRLKELIKDLALTPGRACDLGCGHGGDALWLASLGWQVTAVDVSATAVSRVEAAAVGQGLGGQVRAEQHDLSRSGPPGPFDLVYACYFHSPVAIDRIDVLRRSARQVAPRGYLIIIDHASVAPWSWRLGDEEPVFPTPEETANALTLGDGWHTERCERSERTATGPDGTTATVADNLIALRRRDT